MRHSIEIEVDDEDRGRAGISHTPVAMRDGVLMVPTSVRFPGNVDALLLESIKAIAPRGARDIRVYGRSVVEEALRGHLGHRRTYILEWSGAALPDPVARVTPKAPSARFVAARIKTFRVRRGM
jgi:hypothetical protein